jgi:methylated-DNA-[protein]-cysteine S-methyltransferase
VAVTEVAYDVDGWGTGLLWFADGILVWHELPTPRIDSIQLGAPQPTTRFNRNAKNVTRVKPERDKSVTIVLPAGKPSGSPASETSTRGRTQARVDSPQVVNRLRRYFAGERVGFEDVAIDLDWCTPFQRGVADTLRAVPRGEVVTYGELAALAGHPNAQRAAGTFCAQNRLPLLIPCHRVVAAGGLGSYGSLGTGFKRRLLALEGVRI